MRLRMSAAAGLGLLLVAGVGLAQTPGQKSCAVVDENGKTVIWPDCKPPAEDAPAAAPGATPTSAGDGSKVPASKRFVYPGDPGGDPAAGTPGGAPAAGAPAAAAAAAGSGESAKRFPYPGEPAAGDTAGAGGAAPAGTNGGLRDAGSSGSSSSSGGESSSGAGATPDAGPLGEDDDAAAREAASRKSARQKLPKAPRQSPDEREVEDLKVASFYMDDKNFKGAYARAVDAVGIDEEDADAHVALADAARKLGKLDEALTHYKKALTLDPVPKTKKAAEKALKEMSGG